ncbi:MAG: ABC transporter permease [Gulosibacter sp.]|uniref:ABC transporter permease n=1 Tax=Gulosibacter sp. TaxID=2817531 RepID=UPI003F922BCF
MNASLQTPVPQAAEATGRATPPPKAAGPLTGTAALIRFNLRLDRLRIPIWVLAMGLGVWSSVLALDEAFPTAESLESRATLLTNPATIIMTGPALALDNYTFGAMVANELYLYVLLAAAIMSLLLAVRHTRGEEESGRLELLRSLPVGRFAHPTAAVVTVSLANLLVGLATSLGLVAGEMDATESIAFGLGTALTGMVFAGIAIVIAQLTENARAVTGLTAGTLAAAFLVRGMGDVIEPEGSWLSWFSPLAWAQQTRVFVDLRWWPLAVSFGVVILLFVLAVTFARRRDLGAGLRAPQPGRARASRALLMPWGLADRLTRGTVIVTTLGTVFFGVAMGSLASYLDDMLQENPALADWIAIEGTDLTGEFAAIILSFVLLAPIILAVSGILRLKTEEESGRTEQLIVSGRSRNGYLGGWLSTVAVHTLIVTVTLGLSVGIGVALGTEEAERIGDILLASLLYLPAILLIASLAVALYGALPRLTVIAWVLVIWVAIVLFLGGLLGLPDWAMDLSPLRHTPLYPIEDVAAAPLLIMGGLAALLTAIGMVGFRQRDLSSK